MGFSAKCFMGTLTGVGIFMSLLGSLMVVYWPTIFDTILHEELALTKTSKSNDLWEVTPIPMFIEFYLFNWTNPEDLKKPGAKPILKEIGPYVYREHRIKVVHQWNTDNDTVTFRQNRTWFFEPSLSNGKLDDDIVTVNIPAITAAFSCRNLNYLTKFMLSEAMKAFGTKYWVKKKAKEFIFDGYNDPLLDLAQIIPASLAPASIPFDKFGWFYTRNGSADYDGVFNMWTGVKDIKRLGKLAKWDYTNHTHYYESDCGRVNGSAGELFPPDQNKSRISLFSPDICRTLDLNFKEEVTVHNIRAYRYWGDDRMFANQTKVPDNWCFCPSGHCPPHGALDVSTCKWGAPAFISFPHFYHADPWYREQVIGMDPEENKHQMFIDLEPKSGIPVQVSAAFQINILLQPYKEYKFLHDVPKIYFPAIWFRQTAHVDDKIGPELELLAALPSAGTISSLVLLSIGLTTILVVGIFYLTRRCSKDDETFHGLESEDNTVKRFCSIIHGRFSTGRVQPSLVVTISNGSSILPHFPLGGHHHHHLLSPDVLNTSASIRRLSVPEFPKKDEEQPLFTSFNDS